MPNYNVELWMSPAGSLPKRRCDRNVFVEADTDEQAKEAAVVYFGLQDRQVAGKIHMRCQPAGAIGLSAAEILAPKPKPAPEPEAETVGKDYHQRTVKELKRHIAELERAQETANPRSARVPTESPK